MGQSSSSFSSQPFNDDSDEHLSEFQRQVERQQTHRPEDPLLSNFGEFDNGPSDSLREARGRFMRNRRSSSDSPTFDYMEREDAAPFGNILSNLERSYSPSYDWMGRSIESLVLGYMSAGCHPTYELNDDVDMEGTIHLTTRGSLEFVHRQSPLDFGLRQTRGGSLANYRHSREGDRLHAFRHRRSSANSNFKESMTGRNRDNVGKGPNIVFSLLAREITGRSPISSNPSSKRLLQLGGKTLYQRLDSPAAGIVTEIIDLQNAIDDGDWTATCNSVSRLTPRLVGDPSRFPHSASIDDPNLPSFASPHLAGGGRVGLERDAFVLGGGVQAFLRVFSETAFVGNDLRNDARRLSASVMVYKFASCWNEVLLALRELVFSMPVLVENGSILDGGRLLPFLFTILSHDACFDSAAALIEEIVSLLSHTPLVPTPSNETPIDGEFRAASFMLPVSTFFLGNVPNLYSLWRGFSCRQLAHFCRILALLIFEPEDRQLLESPSVLKSLELLQLRRDRAARAGRDATVDMNQSILLGDNVVMERLLHLLRIMNYAPVLRRTSAYHVMAHFPFISETLIMLGLSETDDWSDVCRLDLLAKGLLESGDQSKNVSDLGNVADMLESLAGSFQESSFDSVQPATQLGQIIHVINAAQQAGVVVGRRGRRNRERENDSSIHVSSVPLYSTSVDEPAPASANLTDQFRMSPGNPQPDLESENNRQSQSNRRSSSSSSRVRTLSQQDAANELQFNALILAPYQVEVLFVFCTLLGGRRKIDAQRFLNDNDLIPILDEMFHRLSFGNTHRVVAPLSRAGDARAPNENFSSVSPGNQPEVVTGIHGPGCECTPESALSVQYLRLLHNFCDRDCDNYTGRRLLLSSEERQYIFSERVWKDANRPENLQPGLFSKLILAFFQEMDDSPHRFWLASCVESFLRGSSPHEQLFAAKAGLLPHLLRDIVSDRLHCAGSLQTSFDLLGEVCKGNPEVLYLLVSTLDEDNFRKLMSAAVANLVDSNVFLRSLLLTVERISAARLYRIVNEPKPNDIWKNHEYGPWTGHSGAGTRFYLTHSWWDASINPLESALPLSNVWKAPHENLNDDARSSDWFPNGYRVKERTRLGEGGSSEEMAPIDAGVGYNGWQYAPPAVHHVMVDDPMAWILGAAVFLPNTIERLTWFLIKNQSRLLRDLLSVVDLRNINHENICCLNTAVVVSLFASRRRQLSVVIRDLKRLNREDRDAASRRREADSELNSSDVMMSASMNQLDIDGSGGKGSLSQRNRRLSSVLGDRTDTLRNFRELLWFWSEYYTHRGRDRLSLEFSSHMRFQDWFVVVSMLSQDDNSSTALVHTPPRMPKSPYQRAARIMDIPRRSA